MNKIKVNQLMLAGLVTLLVFIGVEFLVESLIFRPLSERILQEWHKELNLNAWKTINIVLNLVIALINCTLLTWLYAALRPMFGVGSRTALVASAFAFLFITAFAVNNVNLGTYPPRIALLELAYLIIELPLAILAGARVYEGGKS
jgi:hypothetical protein